jgi:death on curing protein
MEALPSDPGGAGDGEIKLKLIRTYEAIKLHDEILKRDPGMAGVRDYNALQSALYAPERHLYYAEHGATLPELASVMAYEIVKQHPFNDGNKRTAALLIPSFMRAHGIRWRPRHGELVRRMVMIARSPADNASRRHAIESTTLWIAMSSAEYASK